MNSPIQKSRCPRWLFCLALAVLLQFGALPRSAAAAAESAITTPHAIPVQYYPYNTYPPDNYSPGAYNTYPPDNYSPGAYAPYDSAPNDTVPDVPWPYSDSNIRRDVRYLFVVDTFLDAINIRLQVQDGVVILTGRVKTWDNRSRAETDAYAAGARSVVNALKVLPY
jgi:hypothetical protein